MGEIKDPSSESTGIPLLVRLRFAAGWRVPAAYRSWAISQIQSEGWPVRNVLTRMMALFPVVILSSLSVQIALQGSGSSTWYQIVIFPLVWIAFGMPFAIFRAQWLRDRAIAYQLKERSDASSPSDGAGILREILHEIERAMTDGSSADVLARHTAPDYIFTSPAGVVSDRSHVLDGLRAGTVNFTAYAMSDLDVRIYGTLAVVVGRAEGDGINPGGEVFRGALRFTSVWHQVNARWTLVAWHASEVA